MDKRYELYCLADPFFYDSLTGPASSGTGPVDLGKRFTAAERPAPAGWNRMEQDDWVVLRPLGVALPDQGWKVHISVRLDDAPDTVETVWEYCVSHRLAFKFLKSRSLLHLRNAKYADRGTSGKLVTIYPADEDELRRVLTGLGALLDGRPGPYILSDLRYSAGPLYVRYGGITERYCVSGTGQVTPAIADPDGNLVPDRRGPVFTLPPWVPLPEFLRPHLDARNSVTTHGLPYRVERVLHFSNGGGVYRVTDTRTGEPVVLKEARPHAGLDFTGADAVTRLHREADALRALDGLAAAPRLRDRFTVGEHHFVAMDFIPGEPLNRAFVARYPLGGLSAADRAEYTRWAMRICAQTEETVARVHGRGLVVGDLHLANIMIGPDGGLTLIDFEMAHPVGEARRMGLANPGFAAPPGTTGFDIDRYALACLRLALFLPVTELFLLDRGKATRLAEVVREHFPVPADFLDEAVAVVSPARSRRPAPAHPPLEPGNWHALRDSMAEAILRSATPQRDDRLFPGDIEQFASGGLNLAHGAAGVLYALAVTGAGRFPEHERWLLARALRPAPGTRLGLYDGLHGIAHLLAVLDRGAEAAEIAEIASREDWRNLGLSLYGGLAGVGLNHLHLEQATGDRRYLDTALTVADIVADRLGAPDGVPEISGGEAPYAGLMDGSSGPALFLLRLFERTGDAALLDAAETALRQDLRRCARRPDGSLQVDEGWRTMPYLARGSVGIAWVLGEYLRHRPDDSLAAARDALDLAARSPFYIQSGLFAGRAGILAYLCRDRRGGADAPDPQAETQLRALAWHAVDHQGRLAFPGERMLRLSMDLATGTAGVLLAVGAALHEEPAHLPFLGRSRAPAPELGGTVTAHTRKEV